MKIKAMLNNYHNITHLITSFPEIRISTQDSKNENMSTFKVNNKNKWCDYTNEKSLFHNQSLNEYSIHVYYNNILCVKGNVVSINTYDNEEADIIIKSNVVGNGEKITNSIDRCNIMELCNILQENYNVHFNNASIRGLSNLFEDYHYGLNVLEADNYTISDFLNDLSDNAGILSYQEYGSTYLKNMYSENSYVNIINSDDVLSISKEVNNDMILNDYVVKYYLNEETPVTDDDNDKLGRISRKQFGQKIVKEINASQQSNFIIYDKETAVVTGNNYIRRYKNPITVFNVDMQSDYFYELYLGDNYMINGELAQLITKSLNINGNISNMVFWSV